MNRLLSALVTALLAWCGVVQPVQAAVSPPMAAAAAYAYDGHDTSALVLGDASDRGPPGPWSDSLRDQPLSAGTASVYTYDRLVHDSKRARLRTSFGAEVRGWTGQPLHAVVMGGHAGVTRAGVAAEDVAATGDGLLRPGPWARDSVPSSGPGRITQAERNDLNPIGDQYGCHSCGATTPGTKSGNWVGDHQPVTRTVPEGTPQVLYPQCQACSNEQGLWIINLIRQGRL